MKRLSIFRAGVVGFVLSLVKPRGPVTGVSENGHALLYGWDKAPEEDILDRSLSVEAVPPKPTLGLFCYAGPHRGELRLLSRKVETIGSSIDHSIVLTPATGHHPESFRTSRGTNLVLSSEPGSRFLLNGHPEKLASLYDFDEVSLMGNDFLVLEMGER